jgi:hypothetical protein
MVSVSLHGVKRKSGSPAVADPLIFGPLASILGECLGKDGTSVQYQTDDQQSPNS